MPARTATRSADIRAHFEAEAQRPQQLVVQAKAFASTLTSRHAEPRAEDLATARTLLATIEASIEVGALAAAALAADHNAPLSQATVKRLTRAEKAADGLRHAIGRF